MVAEIRILGGRTVLYTDNASLYRYLNKNLHPIKKVPYIQNGKTVGYDFYYHIGYEQIIRQVINGQLLMEMI